MASIFGPTLGGWLTDHWSWRACFWVNLPVGAIAVAAIYFEFPHMKPRGATKRLDWAGFATLITPLMMGAVIGSIVGGQTISRTGTYKGLALVGSALVAGGMILFARMGLDTPRLYVATGMVIAGLGMGLLQPVYTLAVQNVAPRRQMGAATSSTIFFRSIGSTVGVAAFGSIMLTRYHNAFARGVPPQVPARALEYLSNPLMLVQIRPQLEQAFGRFPGGAALLQTLFVNVKTSLEGGLHLIFVCSAVIMSLSVLLHVVLRSEPLRVRVVEPEPASH